ncbi:hypothetical protein GEMRC1_002928 [Eukaryota sp. GEM-RC1]
MFPDKAFITEEVDLTVRGTYVVFEDFMNPDVTFDSLSIENTGVVSLITNYTINLRFLRLVGGYRGGTDLLYVRERLIWNQGGFIDPSLTIAERVEVLDYASVIFEDDVHWIRDSEIRGGRNASLIFNKDLKVYEGGLFTLSPSSFPPFASYVHQTPGDLPVVYVNHGMTLVGSGESFEFSWELQNRGNITVPPGFELMLYKGGYDSVASRLLSEPTSYVLYGAPFPYHYNPDTWCYYNQSIIRLFDHARSEYAGFVCFNKAEIGPFGTIVILKNATICTYSSLSVEGTELIIEGSATFCDLTLATDFVVNPGQSLFISCSLTWLSGTLSGEGSLVILPEAYLYIHPKDSDDDEFYHIIADDTRIINQGVGTINANVTGGIGAEFINHGHVELKFGHWLNDPLVNSSSAISTFINFNRTVITYNEPLLFDWNISQIAGEFVIAKGEIFFSEYSTFSGAFETLPNTIVHVEKDFTFSGADLYLKSPLLFPKAHSTISFLQSSNVNWVDIDFTFDVINGTLVFDSGTNITQSPNEFKLKSGLIDIFSVDSSFSINNLVQSGGIIHVDSLTTGSFISNLKLHSGKIISNSPWTIAASQLIGGIFTGSDVLTLASSTITATSTVNCDASIKSLSTTFVSGLVSGTDSCVIDSYSLVVDTSSQVTLEGCSSTFINNGTLLVENGQLIFRMDLVNRGSIHVQSSLRFVMCQFSIDKTISTSSDGSIVIDSPTTFTSDSLITGNGTLTFAEDSVVNGVVDFDGCVIINDGVDVVFSEATIIKMNLCSVKGTLSLSDSSISLLNVVLDGGSIVLDDATTGSVVIVETISSGELQFKNSVIDLLDVQDLQGGTIHFDELSNVHVNNFTQTGGSTVVVGQFVYFNSSNVFVTGGSFTSVSGFNPINIISGDVDFHQFAKTSTEVDSITLESGRFVSTTDYALNIENLLWNDGVFGGKLVEVDTAVWNGGELNTSSMIYVDDILLTSLADKIFNEAARIQINKTGTWNMGSVFGNSESRVDLPSQSKLVLAGTEGWYVEDGAYPKSAIYTQGDLIFSTPESIDMEWDIFGKRIDVNQGDVVFSDNLVLIEEVYLNTSTTSYLSAKMNVSEYIGGCGDIVINDPNSVVAFNGKVDLCGTLYMKDGLLDLRLSDIQNITIDYTGGTILFREDIEGQDINLPQVQTPLDITQTKAKLVNIGICNSTINVLTSNISKFVVSEMHKNCKINFLPDSIVGELIIKDLYDGELNIKDGSDIKIDQITQHDGAVTVEEGSSPSFNDAVIVINDGKFILEEGSDAKFIDVVTEMTGGDLIIEEGGIQNCPHWECLKLSGDSSVHIQDDSCISFIDDFFMENESKIKSDGLIHTDNYVFNGGNIAPDTVIHVIDEFISETNEPKSIDSNSVLFINNTGSISLDSGSNVDFTFNNSQIVVDHSASLNISSTNGNTVTFKKTCSPCDKTSGFINEGIIRVDSNEKIVFESDLYSSNELVFDRGDVHLKGDSLLDGLVKVNDHTTVTVDGTLLQPDSGTLLINPDGSNSKVVFVGTSNELQGDVHCSPDDVCIEVSSGHLSLSPSLNSSYLNVEVTDDGVLSHEGYINQLVCDVVEGSLDFEQGSVIDHIQKCTIKGSVTHKGGSTTHKISNINIDSGNYTLLANSEVFAADSHFNIENSGSMLVTTGTKLDLQDAVFDLESGQVLFQVDSTSTIPTFSDVTITGGEFQINLNEDVPISDLTLDGKTASRTGSSRIDVTNEFMFTNGALSGPGTTFSHNNAVINSGSEQHISNNHSLIIDNQAAFTRCNVLGYDNGLIHVLENTEVTISGQCHILRKADDTSSLRILNEGILNVDHNDVIFGWFFDNQHNLVITDDGRLTLSGTATNNHSFSTSGILHVTSEVTSTDIATLYGSGEILLDDSDSLLNVFGHYNVSGKLTVNDESATADFKDQSHSDVVNVDAKNGFVKFVDSSLIDRLHGSVSGGNLQILDSSTVSLVDYLTLNGGLIESSTTDFASFEKSVLTVNSGVFLATSHSNSIFSDTIAVVNGGEFQLHDVDQYIPHFEHVTLNGGLFNISIDNEQTKAVVFDDLLLDGGKRTGDRTLNVSNSFEWKSGTLDSDSVTHSLVNTFISDDKQKLLTNSHTLSLFNYTVFSAGTLIADENTLIYHNSDSLFLIDGKGVIETTATSSLPVLFNSESSVIQKVGCDVFELYIVLQNEGTVLLSDATSCSPTNVLKVGTNSWSSGSIILKDNSDISFTGTFSVNESSLVSGSSESYFTLSESSSFVIISGVFNHSGDTFISDTVDGSRLEITDLAVINEMNLAIVGDGNVEFLEDSFVPLVSISRMEDGHVNFHNQSTVLHLKSVNMEGGIVDVLHGSFISLSQSDVHLEGGQLTLHSGAISGVTNSTFTLLGGTVHIQDNSLATDPIFASALIRDGELRLDSQEPMYVATLTVEGGKRSGTGILEVTDQLIWSGGQFVEEGITRNMRLMNVDGVSVMTIDLGHVLENYGNVSLLAGTLLAGSNTAIINQPGSLFTIGGQGQLNSTASGDELPIFKNLGTFIKGSTNETFEFLLALQNYDYVLVENGTLSVGTDSYSDGIIQINDGCTFELTGKFEFLNSSLVRNSPGTIHVSMPESDITIDGVFDHSGVLKVDGGVVTFVHQLSVETASIVQSDGIIHLNGLVDALSFTSSGGLVNLLHNLTVLDFYHLSVSDTGEVVVHPHSNVSFTPSSWSIAGGSVFFDGNALLALSNVSATITGGHVLFDEINSTPTHHFRELIICGGVFELNHNHSLTVDLFHLCGGTRSGTGNIDVVTQFIWSEGVLTDPGSTTLFAPSIFRDDSPKSLVNGHSLINHDNLEIIDTSLMLVNGSQLLNNASGVILFTNHSSLVGEINSLSDPSVINKGTIIVAEASTGVISSDFFNYNYIAVTDSSSLDLGGISSFSHGLINVSGDSVIKVHGSFNFHDKGAVEGSGSLVVYSKTGNVTLQTDLSPFTSLSVLDEGLLVLSGSSKCEFNDGDVTVSNATLVVEQCNLEDVLISTANQGIAVLNGSSKLVNMDLNIDSGSLSVFDPVTVTLNDSSWVIGPEDGTVVFHPDSLLTGSLASLQLLNDSLLVLSNNVTSDFIVNTLEFDGGHLSYLDLTTSLPIRTLTSTSGLMSGVGEIVVTDDILVTNLNVSDLSSVVFNSSSTCNLLSGTLSLVNTSVHFNCQGVVSSMTLDSVDSSITEGSDLLSFSNSTIIGDDVSSLLFNQNTVFSGSNDVSISTNFNGYSTISLNQYSTFGLPPLVLTHESASTRIDGTVDCSSSPCLVNYGQLVMSPTSINQNVSILSKNGTTYLSRNASFVSSTRVSSTGGSVFINSTVPDLHLISISGGNISIASSIKQLSVSKATGGDVVFTSDSTVHSIPDVFELSDTISVAFESNSFLNPSGLKLNINGGSLFISDNVTVDCDVSSKCYVAVSNGSFVSKTHLILHDVSVSGGVFESNSTVDNLSLQGGSLVNSIIESNQLLSCGETVIDQAHLLITNSSLVQCESLINLHSSSIVFSLDDRLYAPHLLTVIDRNNSLVTFTYPLIVHEADQLNFASPTHLNGLTNYGNLTITHPKMMSSDVELISSLFKFEELTVPFGQSLISSGESSTVGHLTNEGTIHVRDHLNHSGSIILTPSSNFTLSLYHSNDVYVHDSVTSDYSHYNGTFYLDFFPSHPINPATKFHFFSHGLHDYKFALITGNCLFNFGFNYTDNHMFAQVGAKIDPEHSFEFYVSPFGFDSVCCGTATAPCKSVPMVLSRTLPGDKITLLPGTYEDYTPVNLDNSQLGFIEGNDARFVCTHSEPGMKISSEKNLHVSNLRFENCLTAIQSVSSSLVVTNLDVVSDAQSSSQGRIFDLSVSKVELKDSKYSQLEGPLFTVMSSSHLGFTNLTVSSCSSVIFYSRFSTVHGDHLLVSESNSALFNSMASSLSVSDASVVSCESCTFFKSTNDDISFVNFTVSDSKFDQLLLAIHSKLSFSDLKMTENLAGDLIFSLFKSILVLSHSNLSPSSPLLFADDSNLMLEDCVFSDYYLESPLMSLAHARNSISKPLMYIEKSRLSMSSSVFTSFGTSVLDSRTFSTVSVLDSEFKNIHNSAISCSDSTLVSLSNVSFFNSHSTNGGALFVGSRSQVHIINSLFSSCSAINGGAVYWMLPVTCSSSILPSLVMQLLTLVVLCTLKVLLILQ